MAIVLVIIGLLLGGMLMPLSAQLDQRRNSEAQKAMDEIIQALIGFAISHSATDGKPYLPCPNTNNDGNEGTRSGGGDCVNPEGMVPWATLGIADTDPWGNRYRYRVTSAFSNSTTGFILATPGDIKVVNAATGGTNVATVLPAIILSHGKNGLGAYNQAGGTNATTGASADELENTNGDASFVYHAPSPTFDDLAAWVSPNTLFNRVVTAGKLP